MAQLKTLGFSRPLPSQVQYFLQEGDWDALARALRSGLPANLVHDGDEDLFSTVLHVLQAQGALGFTSSAKAPLDLLLAFLEANLAPFGYRGQSVISQAVRFGQWDWVEVLLEAGYCAESTQGAPVGHALVEGRMIRRLRDQEEDIEDLSTLVFNRDTLAEEKGVRSCLRVLKAHGVDLDAFYCDEDAPCAITPLQLAIMYSDDFLVDCLLDEGVELGGCGPAGEMNQLAPVCLASKKGLEGILGMLLNRITTQQLGEYGPDAMHLAASRGGVACMKKLHEAGVAYDVPSREGGFLPLHQAALYGNRPVIDFLVSKGMNWEQCSESGVSPAHVLHTHHPQLSRHYSLPVASDNIIPLRPRV